MKPIQDEDVHILRKTKYSLWRPRNRKLAPILFTSLRHGEPSMRTCLKCSASYAPIQKHQKYCSQKCRKNDLSNKWERLKYKDPEYRLKLLAKHAAYRNANRGKVRASNTKYHRSRILPFWHKTIGASGRRAKQRGWKFDLTFEWAAARFTGKCELSGLPFKELKIGARDRAGPFSPSIDRIDQNKGYTQDNCRFILHALNMMKGIGSDDDMWTIVDALIANRPHT